MKITAEEIATLIDGHRYPESNYFDADGEPVATYVGPGAVLGFYQSRYGVDAHWGAAGVGELVSGLKAAISETPSLTEQHLRIEFVPEQFEAPLSALGFRTTSEWVDAWIRDISACAQPPSGRVAIRPLVASDGAAVGRITRSCRNASRDFLGETDAFAAEWLAEAPNAGFVAEDGGDPVGVAFTTVYGADSPRGPVCFLRELAVTPAFQGRGIGRELSLTVLRWGREQGATRGFLHVDSANPAVHLYRSLGYELVPGRGQINMMSRAVIDGDEVVFRPA